MALSYADITASTMVAVETAAATTLSGETILYPGFEWATAGNTDFAAVGVAEAEQRPDRLRAFGHSFTLGVLIFVNLSAEDAYKRETMAEKWRAAFENTTFAIKDYQSGDGTSTLGLGTFAEAVVNFGLVPIEEKYTAEIRIPFRVEET